MGVLRFLSYAVSWVHHCYPASFYVPNVLNCMIAVLFFVYYSLINENGSLFRRLSEFVVCPRLHYWNPASYCIRSSHRRCACSMRFALGHVCYDRSFLGRGGRFCFSAWRWWLCGFASRRMAGKTPKILRLTFSRL